MTLTDVDSLFCWCVRMVYMARSWYNIRL